MNWKRMGKKLLFPPLWVIVVLVPICAAALITVFLEGWEEHPVAYAVYVLSAYTVTALTVFCAITLPRYFRAAKEKVYSTALGNRYMTDAAFRTEISLYLSLGINLVYVAVNLVSGFLYNSAWFIILSFYYTILSVMRFLLLRYVRRNAMGEDLLSELKWSRVCAVILMSLNFVLTGAILMILYMGRGYEYKGILIFVMAAYTTYITVNAVRNLFSSRKYHSPVMSASKTITLAAALVSVLSLETAMLTQFGKDGSELFRRIIISLTGGGICLVVTFLSVYTVVRTTRAIREINGSET